MGQEIQNSHFSEQDFALFRQKLQSETASLKRLFETTQLSQEGPVAGFEIEAWLINQAGEPVPKNETFLKALNDPMVVHELSRFNIEMNIEPDKLQGNVFSTMEKSLSATWKRCTETARELDTEIIMIGILPSVRDEDLTLDNMTKSNRYKALNKQVMQLRNGVPLHLDIRGREKLKADHFDVMLESAATSFQIHLQTPLHQATGFFNLAMLLSGPMVAVTANSPYLFGHELWDETRIPLFEQAVECGELAHRRVTFGDNYIRHSLFENFQENFENYPVLVPNLYELDHELMPHLRFHNGTIWRWNRPLLGFDDDGTPHLRIEHRVVPAGPSIVDSIANAAFFYGLMFGLVREDLPSKLPFPLARENFYQCAKEGMHALINWPGTQETSVRQILLKILLPRARHGLHSLGIDQEESDYYMDIIEKRISSGQNGAEWQRRWVATHGRNMRALTLSYLEHQDSGLPVAQWKL